MIKSKPFTDLYDYNDLQFRRKKGKREKKKFVKNIIQMYFSIFFLKMFKKILQIKFQNLNIIS